MACAAERFTANGALAATAAKMEEDGKCETIGVENFASLFRQSNQTSAERLPDTSRAARGWSIWQGGWSIRQAATSSLRSNLDEVAKAERKQRRAKMRASHGFRTHSLMSAFIVLCSAQLPADQAHGATKGSQEATTVADGQHDFDWDMGTWKTHQKRLLHPLTGSTTWVEYNGTDVVRKIWDGANLGEIRADGPAGHLELFTLRLYNPQTREWSIYFSSSTTGALSPPAVGAFKNGRGEFYDQEAYNGRTILLRFSVSDITANSCRFEQAFSADGGRTWETNFVVTETLVKS